LKKSIFQRILRDNPVAASHYVQYLYSKQYIDELIDNLEYVLCILNNKVLIKKKIFFVECWDEQKTQW